MDIRNYSYNKLSYLIFRWLGVKSKTLIFLCTLAAILSIVVACNDNSNSISSNDNSTSISKSPSYFPVQKAGMNTMEALLEGVRLELDDNGCLRVKYFDDNYLLIWPHGFSMRIKGEEIQVIDDSGQVVACVGDKINVGGGEFPGEKAREYIEESIVEQPLPDDCPGPYWIVGETVKTVN